MNAIIRRELIAQLRSGKAVLLQLFTPFLFALLVILRWPTDSKVDLSGSASRQVLQIFGYGLLVTVILLVPIFPATSMVREKIKGTLALLLNSPLKSWKIYLGKMIGSLGFVVILALSSLPAAAACFAMGGISLENEVIPLYAVLMVATMLYATLGLLVSTYANSSDAALRITYGSVLLLSIVTLGPYQILRGSASMFGEAAAWLRCLSPIPAVMTILGQGDAGASGFTSSDDVVMRFLILGSALTVIFVIFTMSRLNYKIFDRSRAAGVMTDDRTTGGKVARRIFFLFDPQRRSKGIGDWTNPILIKEFRCRRFGRLHWLARLVAICAIASLLMTYSATSGTVDWGVERIAAIMVLLQVALLILITPSLASGLISGEVESKGWQLLQSTPLSVGTIVRGKLMSAVWTLLLVLCATLPGYAVIVYLKPAMTQQVLRVLICLGVTATFAVLLSAAVSSFSRTTSAATSVSYSLLLIVCAGTMLFWLGRDAPFGHDLVESVLLINPMAAALHASDAPDFSQYNLLPMNWYIMGATCVTLFFLMSFRTWQLTRPS